jgi:gliding motility-associated-like protein
VPVALPGSSPSDGAGTGSYSYLWQQSSNGTSFGSASGVNNSTTGNYQAPALTDTTWYRRIVNSGVYKAAVVCTNTSQPIRINVHKPVLNNNIALFGGGTLQTICNNQAPYALQGTTPSGGTNIPGDFAYLWKYSTDNLTFNPIPGVITTFNYGPPELNVTTYYRRDATSGACTVSSNPIAITVLPTITNNTLSGNSKVCFSRVPDIITGATLAGGSGIYKYFWQQSTDGGTQWDPAAGTNSSSNYQAPALSVPTKYKRTVTSGLNDCCTSVSNIFDIGIDPLPVSKIDAGPDTIIYSVEKIYHMKAINPTVAGETGVWSVLNNGTGKPEEISNSKTIVNSLSLGTNSFLWTVSKGNCDLKDSVKIVLLQDFEPEGFSPNGDAWNNTFVIEGLDQEDNYLDLSIVNGAGTEVFSTTNRNGQKWKDWDGKNSSGLDLSEGTYYYMLKITPKSLAGSVIKKKGFIILKRY